MSVRGLLSVLMTLVATGVPGAPARAQAPAPIAISVDARDVDRDIVHVSLDVPIAGGATSLVFPKWVPGEHSPSNPLNDVVLLRASANGSPVAWTRDPVDVYHITFAAPPGATTLTLHYDTVLAPGQYATSRLALLNWNDKVFYPAGARIDATPIVASLVVPAGWKYATALDAPRRSGDRIDFAPVTLERLVDSPVLVGADLTTTSLGPDAELDVASDAPVAPVVDPKVAAHFTSLVKQARELFGSRHWRDPYRFLITESDTISYTGLEHHESSWNGVDTDTLATEKAAKIYAGDLLTHEFTHSWNGKYRRPAGLFRPDYQADETTDLLWVYEGLTEYYGDVLAVRAGFWSPAEYRATTAAKYAGLDAEGGRATRSLADTTFDERLSLLGAPPRASFAEARRSSEDYYAEAELMWLDADTLIRERSGGRRSLDDFARAFFGAGGDSGPAVIPYTREDVVAAMNAVQPYDWEAFFHARIDVPTPHPPADEFARSGYAFGFAGKSDTQTPSKIWGGGEDDDRYGLGARISKSGGVSDVVAGSPAATGGLVPGMTIVALDGRRFASDDLVDAIQRDATTHAAMTLLVTNREAFETLTISYAGGPRLPVLTRTNGPDLLANILRPR